MTYQLNHNGFHGTKPNKPTATSSTKVELCQGKSSGSYESENGMLKPAVAHIALELAKSDQSKFSTVNAFRMVWKESYSLQERKRSVQPRSKKENSKTSPQSSKHRLKNSISMFKISLLKTRRSCDALTNYQQNGRSAKQICS